MLSRLEYFMTDLRSIFAELGISQYLDDFIDQGFDSWQTILDITESDFDFLKVKLGHRRKLQRKIANSRGYSSDRALEPRNSPSSDRASEEQQKSKLEVKDTTVTTGTKRKYRRHPKPDENAPERPPSAYVIFSNKMREELKGRNLSFTEIAKLVGERWQLLSISQKEQFEQQAFIAKERYNNELNEYKKTNLHKEYSRYLADFKARYSRQNSIGETENVKRLKLEIIPINRESSVGSSTASQPGEISSANSQSELASSVSSPPSTNSSWPRSRISEEFQTKDLPRLTTSALSMANNSSVKSPTLKTPTSLMSFRDVALNGSSPSYHISRDSRQDETPSFCKQMKETEVRGGRSSSPQHLSQLQPSYQYSSSIHQLQNEKQNPMNACPISSSVPNNKNSPALGLQIPWETSHDRSHQISMYIDQRTEDKFERQLPPIRPLSLSPKSRAQGMLKQEQFTSDIFNRFIDISPRQIPPIRNLGDLNSRITHRIMPISTYEHIKLDPASALLKAAETYNNRIKGVI